MATTDTAAGVIRRTLEDQDRTTAWLARRTDIPYKRLLSQIKHETRPLELVSAVAASKVLGIELTTIAELSYEIEEAAS